jgi:F0F1-type ATP synthase epsilon subunit
MLKMRLGEKLKDHLWVLLNRFATREIPGGSNLLQAFAYIAAMHAEGLMFLSKPVLAEVLRCEERALKSKVLFPLGKEAAAIQSSQFILTRHKTIAQASVEILSEQFAEDVDELYVDLSKAAITAGDKGIHIPEYSTWKHRLTKHFTKSGNINLAIEIARGMLERTPNDVHLLVSVAKLYRDIDESEQAAQLFREKSIQIHDDRVFFAEWGTVEANLNNRALAVWIQATSLADHRFKDRIDNQRARIGLTTIGLNLIELYTAFNNRIFIEGQSAISCLGLLITTPESDQKGFSHFQAYLKNSRAEGISEMDWQAAFQTFLNTIQAAYDLCGETDNFPDLPLPKEMTFNGLRYLIENAIERDKNRR